MHAQHSLHPSCCLPVCCAVQVHDIDGRVSQVVSLLQGHGFVHVTVDQLGHLQGTDLFNLYATRTPPQPLAQ